ncbi:MAG: ABC transporter ATP-binding protein/permease [Pseudomonadota bacterium]
MPDHAKDDQFLKPSLWALIKPYFFSEERWIALGLLVANIALSLAIIWVNVELNGWKGEFYNSLQNKNLSAFKTLILQFTGWAFLFIIFSVYQTYLMQLLQIRWRKWLTDIYLARWMSKATHYRMTFSSYSSDNPDQRIAEDLKLFVDATLSLFFGLITSIVSFISFVGILWVLSGPITLFGITIPGYMVWIALAYALVGSLGAHKIGRPLIYLNVDQQHREADFRFALVRARENSEGIALYHGEPQELKLFQLRFAEVVKNWWLIMKQQKRFSWFASFYGQLAVIFPILIASPRYFSGAIQLGGLMQISNAFDELQKALSWFVDSYTRIAEWRSSIERLNGFIKSMEQSPVNLSHTQANHIAFNNTQLMLPNGQALLNIEDVSIEPGQHTLLTGASGSGKSTLFRLMAGIWPFATGTIKHPSEAEILFLPQRPYLPIGSLKMVLTYPETSSAHSEEILRDVLTRVYLPHLIPLLNETHYWTQNLSPGEQQRLAFARALLIKPKWLFLDESTSALDFDVEQALYTLLHESIPQTTIISIAHRHSLRVFHKQEWAIISPRHHHSLENEREGESKSLPTLHQRPLQRRINRFKPT